MPEIVAIIQARMSSTRLPGKVMLDLGGRTVLSRMVERVKQSKLINRVVVATTIDPMDNPIIQLCQQENIDGFRGSLPDVLDRYYQAARLVPFVRRSYHNLYYSRKTRKCSRRGQQRAQFRSFLWKPDRHLPGR